MGEWKTVKLGEILSESKEFEDDPSSEKKITVRLNCKGVEKRPNTLEKEGATKNYKRKAGQFIYGRQNFHKGAFGIIPDELDGYSSSADLPSFDVSSSCMPSWIVSWFKTSSRYEHLSKFAKGVGSQRVATSDFLSIEIPLPDIDEQKVILQKLYSFENQTNSLTKYFEIQSSYLSKLRQSILQEAIEGKLTVDWREKHPIIKGEPNTDAAALLEKIKADFAISNRRKKYELLSQEEIISLGKLPESWVPYKLGDFVRLERGRFSIRPRNDKTCFGGNYPFIQIGSLNNFGDIITEYKQTLNEKGYAASKEFKKGTIVVAIVGGTIGNLGVLGFDMCFPDSIIGIQPSILRNQSYILYFLRYKQPEIRKAAYQMAGQPNIKIPTLAELTIPLPPLAEQQAIVERVDKLLAMVDDLEKQVSDRKQQAEQLMQAVLREAFEG